MNKLGYIIAFTAGAGAGVLASMTYFKRKYQTIADEEIASVIAAYRKDISKEEQSITEEKTDDILREIEAKKIEYADDILREIEAKKIEYRDLIDGEGYISNDMDRDHPREEVGGVYEISEEDYSETELSYDKYTLQYFVDDDMLYDPDGDNEEDRIMLGQTIGDEGINRVRTSDDTHTLYFRNDNYGADYEVVKVAGSYYEDR